MHIRHWLSSSRTVKRILDESAQDAYEYVLAISVAVVVFTALWAFVQLVPDVVGRGCPAVDTAAAPGATTGSCVDEGP
jgi:hypothetical protein